MKKEQLEELMNQYLEGRINDADRQGLAEQFMDDRQQEDLTAVLQTILERTEGNPDMIPAEWWKMYSVVTGIDKAKQAVVKRMVSRRWYWAAAVITGLLLFAGYWFTKPSNGLRPVQDVVVQQVQDIAAPDKNRARIKLADGTIVYLDSAANGELVAGNGVQLLKTADGAIEYRADASAAGAALRHNTVQNPRGSKVIAIQLTDGSRVWLNAGSSFTYPVVFNGDERKVSISGEAYFEIAPNAAKPFTVSKEGMEVTVLGTHFNVRAYDDDRDIHVTLLEGSVRVQATAGKRASVVLKPGQQAVVQTGSDGQSPFIGASPDLEQVMAWKNGIFLYNETALEEIMRELARWYDVDIAFEEEAIKKAAFTGETKRTENVSEMLKMLEMTGVIRFTIEGRKIIVRK
jgi:transmembrane sensor